jgi:hypothetical protein
MEGFALDTSFTFEIVFKQESFTPFATILDMHDSDGSNSLSLRMNGDSTKLVTSLSNQFGKVLGNMTCNVTSDLNLNQWTTVIWSINSAKGGNQTLYIQGIEVGSLPAPFGYNISSSIVREVNSLGGGSRTYLDSCCGFNTTKSEGMLDAT